MKERRGGGEENNGKEWEKKLGGRGKGREGTEIISVFFLIMMHFSL